MSQNYFYFENEKVATVKRIKRRREPRLRFPLQIVALFLKHVYLLLFFLGLKYLSISRLFKCHLNFSVGSLQIHTNVHTYIQFYCFHFMLFWLCVNVRMYVLFCSVYLSKSFMLQFFYLILFIISICFCFQLYVWFNLFLFCFTLQWYLYFQNTQLLYWGTVSAFALLLHF